MIIGKQLRELREQKGLLLRQVAASLEVDTAFISKIERGEKNIKKEHIIKLANIYQTDQNQLLVIWLADQVFDLVNSDSNAIKALEYVIDILKSPKK